MEKKSILFILIVVVFAAIIGLFFWMNSRPVTGSFSEGQPIVKKTDAVTALYVVDGGMEVKLEKSDSVWMITSPVSETADEEKMQTVLKQLADSKLLAPVSENPSKHSLFGVDSTAKQITVTEDGAVTAFFAGKTGKDYSSSYIRLTNSDRVYLAGSLFSSVTGNVKEYRNKNLLKLSLPSVTAVQIESSAETFTFTNDSTGWKIDGLPVEDDKMRPFEQNLARLDADDISDTLNVSNIPYPVSLTVSIVSLSGNATIRFYKLPETLTWLAVRDGDQKVYSVSDWKVDRMHKPKSYWKNQ